MKKVRRNIRSTTERNIDAVSVMEQEALDQRSKGARVIESIVIRAGQLWFAVFNVVLFAAWISQNLLGPRGLRFDPFPFPILSMFLEALAKLDRLSSEWRAAKNKREKKCLERG